MHSCILVKRSVEKLLLTRAVQSLWLWWHEDVSTTSILRLTRRMYQRHRRFKHGELRLDRHHSLNVVQSRVDTIVQRHSILLRRPVLRGSTTLLTAEPRCVEWKTVISAYDWVKRMILVCTCDTFYLSTGVPFPSHGAPRSGLRPSTAFSNSALRSVAVPRTRGDRVTGTPQSLPSPVTP